MKQSTRNRDNRMRFQKIRKKPVHQAKAPKKAARARITPRRAVL